MSLDSKRDYPTDPQQSYFRRNARSDGNRKEGPRGHDVGLRSEGAENLNRESVTCTRY